MNELISVVMPAYNAERTIGEAISSVLAQTYRDFELIVIDDCSSDGTYRIACGFAETDKRMRVYRNEKNSGVSATRNRGVSLSLGKYAAFLDSDDIWRSDKLEKQAILIEKYPESPIFYTGSAFIDAEGVMYGYTMPVPEKVDFKQLLRMNYISCSSAVARRELLLKYPMAHDGMHEDYATWLLMLKEGGSAVGVDEPLLIYRISPNTKSSNKIRGVLMRYRVYRYVGLGFFESLYYIAVYAAGGLKKYRNIIGSKKN